MAKPARKPTESPNPVTTGPKLVIEGIPDHEPTKTVTIWITSDHFSSHIKMVGTEAEINDRVNEILTEGLITREGKRTLIYPAHTIYKVEVVEG